MNLDHFPDENVPSSRRVGQSNREKSGASFLILCIFSEFMILALSSSTNSLPYALFLFSFKIRGVPSYNLRPGKSQCSAPLSERRTGLSSVDRSHTRLSLVWMKFQHICARSSRPSRQRTGRVSTMSRLHSRRREIVQCGTAPCRHVFRDGAMGFCFSPSPALNLLSRSW